jgi:hypothetical protein
MTAIAAIPERELLRLYERYKALTLAATAALILARPVGELRSQAETLRAECRAAGAGEGSPGAACSAAADDLAELLGLASAGRDTAELLERVRASHRRLRRGIWDVQPCEYVPCCVSDAHHD